MYNEKLRKKEKIMETQHNNKVIALLIDAENISTKYMKTILDEVSLYGTPAYKRIYGDWTSADMSAWKKTLNEHNISPVQQFSYTQGKNASDSAMIIDAMDILYAKNVDGFCLVSSDSDFTRLASRLRESRMFVIGMGESKTPLAFKSACDTFKYLDILQGLKSQDKKQIKTIATEPASKTKKTAKPKAQKQNSAPITESILENEEELMHAFVPLSEIVEKIKEIIDYESNTDGYTSLSQIGVTLSRMYADFDSRNYGFNKLHKLIDSTKAFETKYEQMAGGGRNLTVKNKA